MFVESILVHRIYEGEGGFALGALTLQQAVDYSLSD